MKWAKVRPRIPDHNERRFLRQFAWRKTEVGDHIVWLESYEIEERYFQPAGGGPGWWSEVKRYTLEDA